MTRAFVSPTAALVATQAGAARQIAAQQATVTSTVGQLSPPVVVAPSGSIPPGPPNPVPTPARFFEAAPWRWVVTDLQGATQTFLDPLAMNRQITYTLNDAAVAVCDLPADDPEVNILQDGEPFVSFADKLLFCFRRENINSAKPWVCRYAGIISSLNDEIVPGSDAPTTHLTAYDPWKYLDERPVVDNKTGGLPGQGGVTYPADGIVTPAFIAWDLLVKTVTYAVAEGPATMPYPSEVCFIDFKTGHVPPGFDDTTPIAEPYNFQQGMNVGDAWRQLATDGLCDIVLTPKFPMTLTPEFGSPAYAGAGGIVQMNVYALAGDANNNKAIFSWDKPGRSLVGVNRLQDSATLANHVQFYAGAAGTPVALQTDANSTLQYGPYWYQDQITGKLAYPAFVEVLALAQLLQRKYGQPTITVDPAPEWSPIPLLEYGLGDQVPLYASDRLRAAISPKLNTSTGEWDNLCRIWAIPITIPDDGPETVTQLLLTLPSIPTRAPVVANALVSLSSENALGQSGRRSTMSVLRPPAA